MNIKEPDKIHFQCAYCGCTFSIEAARAAAEQDITCPNCMKTFDVNATKSIGRAVKELFGIEPIGFTWWLE